MIMQLINDSIIICIAAAGGEDPAAQAGLHGGGRHRHRRCGPRPRLILEGVIIRLTNRKHLYSFLGPYINSCGAVTAGAARAPQDHAKIRVFSCKDTGLFLQRYGSFP